jgi:Uncharacterized conserved protein, contains double-stranded beta-helix domain
MSTSIKNYITHSHQKEWQPLVEHNVHYKGVFVKSLRFDEATQRSKTILLKFEPGASYPFHNHPAGEELIVLEGEVIIEGEKLVAGDYLYTPPGFKHAVHSAQGGTLFFMIPEEVELLER